MKPTLGTWSKKYNWRNWLARHHTCCRICYVFGDALGNPRKNDVLIVKGAEMYPMRHSKDHSLNNTKKGLRLHRKIARDAFKAHVKTHHPEWLNDRLDWTLPSVKYEVSW